MAVQGKTEPKWPSSLDLEDWFAFSLGEKDEVSRRLVLEEFAVNGLPKKFQGHVEKLATQDPSYLLQEMACNIIYLESTRAETDLLPKRLETTPQSLRDLLETAKDLFRKAVLKVSWRPPSPELLDIWRDKLLTEEIPELVAIGLSLLAKYGNPSDSRFAGTFFDSKSPDVVKAAIDLLFHQDKEILKQRMAEVLSHQNLDIRFHAIRRLAAIDLHEALQYLNHTIEGDDPFSRRRAIQELSLLQIKDAEPSYIKILGLETQPLLLAMAGSTLASNPKPDLPPLIYDIILMSKGIKKHILDLTLRQVVDSIKAAGILTVSTEEYIKSLHEELQSRRNDLIIALALRDLRHKDLEIRKQAFEKLHPLAVDPRVQKAFRTRLKHETDPDLLGRMKPLSEEVVQNADSVEISPTPPSPEATGDARSTPPSSGNGISTNPAAKKKSLDQEVSSGNFFQLSPRDQTKLFSEIMSREQFTGARESLLKIVDKSSERPVAMKALKCFESFGNSSDVDCLLPFLKSKDPSIVGQTLRTLSHLDFEKIAIAINPLLRDDDLAIKAAALEVYITCDKDGALQYLKSMLLSSVAAVRRKALTIAPLLDFASIESILVNILNKDPHPDIQSQTGFLLASNPTEAGLKALFRHTHPVRGNPGAEMQELWEIARPNAAKFFSCPPEKIDSAMETMMPEFDNLQKDGPSYAFRKVVQERSEAFGLASAGTTIGEFLAGQRENLAGLFVCAIIYMILSYIALPPLPASPSYRRDVPPGSATRDEQPEAISKTPIPTPPGVKDGAWAILGEARQDASSPQTPNPKSDSVKSENPPVGKGP